MVLAHERDQSGLDNLNTPQSGPHYLNLAVLVRAKSAVCLSPVLSPADSSTSTARPLLPPTAAASCSRSPRPQTMTPWFLYYFLQQCERSCVQTTNYGKRMCLGRQNKSFAQFPVILKSYITLGKAPRGPRKHLILQKHISVS